MEAEKKAAEVSREETLKAQYGGKVYRVGLTIPVDDEEEKEFSYYFKRPSVASYDPLRQERIPDRDHEGEQGVHAGRRH